MTTSTYGTMADGNRTEDPSRADTTTSGSAKASEAPSDTSTRHSQPIPSSLARIQRGESRLHRYLNALDPDLGSHVSVLTGSLAATALLAYYGCPPAWQSVTAQVPAALHAAILYQKAHSDPRPPYSERSKAQWAERKQRVFSASMVTAASYLATLGMIISGSGSQYAPVIALGAEGVVCSGLAKWPVKEGSARSEEEQNSTGTSAQATAIAAEGTGTTTGDNKADLAMEEPEEK